MQVFCRDWTWSTSREANRTGGINLCRCHQHQRSTKASYCNACRLCEYQSRDRCLDYGWQGLLRLVDDFWGVASGTMTSTCLRIAGCLSCSTRASKRSIRPSNGVIWPVFGLTLTCIARGSYTSRKFHFWGDSWRLRGRTLCAYSKVELRSGPGFSRFVGCHCISHSFSR